MIKRTLFFTNKSSLTTKYEQLVIKSETRETTIPIEDIGFVVIEHPEIYISIPALNKLTGNNVSVIFCNEKHLPTGMLLNLEGHHLQQQLFQNQIQATEPLKKQLWQQTIKAKITNQAQVLELQDHLKHPLKHYESKVLSGDTDNREAAAAAYYWKHVFPFEFKRERYGAFPNLFLNYGYTILRAAMARALSGVGLLNTLGIHHHNKYNAFCLADDIMEPYRPFVDRTVLEILNEFDEEDLIVPIKTKLLNVLTETVYFEDKKSPLMVGLTYTAQSLQSCFSGKTRKLNYPKLWN